MSDFVILGTDTDRGKTTFALLWLALYHGDFDYWKPVETGESDTEKVQRLVPQAHCHRPTLSLAKPVAPPLAARAQGASIPSAAELARQLPKTRIRNGGLVIETYGSPVSPLNERELQIEFVRQLGFPLVLVSSSALGAIGRTLQSLYALWYYSLHPVAVVLLGQPDEYAADEIRRHGRGVAVYSLQPPEKWAAEGIRQSATQQRATLAEIEKLIAPLQRVQNDFSRSCQGQPPAVPTGASVARTVQLEALLESDRKYLWHPYTPLRSSDPPVAVVSVQDEFLTLADGCRIIDGISSWWTILHGHRHPVLMGALARAQANFDHVLFAGATHAYGVRHGLRQAAQSRPVDRQLFIVTESLFSMVGDVAPLAALVDLAERYGAAVIVDEAHATGCFGPAGAGLVDAAGLRRRILASVHTGGKALAVVGAYVCGSRKLKEFLINRCRQFIFTTALPPVVGSWWLDTLALVRRDDAGRAALHQNAARFRSLLSEQGIQPCGSHYLIPVILGSDQHAVRAAQQLQAMGFDIRAIRPPTVPPGTSRLRISVHADHDHDIVEKAAAAVAAVVRQAQRGPP